MNSAFYILIIMLVVMGILNGGASGGLSPDAIRRDGDQQVLRAELFSTIQNINTYELTYQFSLNNDNWKAKLRQAGFPVPSDRNYVWTLGENANGRYICMSLQLVNKYQQKLLQEFVSEIPEQYILSDTCGDTVDINISDLVTPSITVFYK